MKKDQIIIILKRITLGLFFFILVPLFARQWYEILPAERVNINEVLERRVRMFAVVAKSERDGTLSVEGFTGVPLEGYSYNIPIQKDFVKVRSDYNSKYMARDEQSGLRVVLRTEETSRYEYIVRDNTVIPYSRKIFVGYEFLLGGATTFLFWWILRTVKRKFGKDGRVIKGPG